MEQVEKTRIKEMIVGETLIGTQRSDDNGVQTEYRIYYGNVVWPLINDKLVHLSMSRYNEMLNGFLKNTEEGKEFIIPDNAQKEKDILYVLDHEEDVITQMASKPMEEVKTEEKPVFPTHTTELTEETQKRIEELINNEEPYYEMDSESVVDLILNDRNVTGQTTPAEPEQPKPVVDQPQAIPEPVQPVREENISENTNIPDYTKKIKLQTAIIGVQFICIVILILLSFLRK